MKSPHIGILALQGSFAEHGAMLDRLGQEYVWVRSGDDLSGLTHLIIPGGESTTLLKLLKNSGMWSLIKKSVQRKELKIMGTCAGAILCEKLGMRIRVSRNAYGAQQSSFTADLDSSRFPGLRGVFIRAPKISVRAHCNTPLLATYKDEPVMVEQDNFLVMSFHPELAGEERVYEYFLNCHYEELGNIS